jgi:SAM-dependent methyltransferase
MPAEFDRHSADYEMTVERAIGFARQPHEVYIEAKARKLLELARRRLGGEPASVLDVGCGLGLMERHLEGRVSSLHGVDVSEPMIWRARQEVPGAEFRVSRPDKLPYADGRFDVAFTVCVLHHMEPRQRGPLLAELGRVTRPSGLVVVFEHNPWNPLTRQVVRGCSFDEGAQLVRLRQAAAALRSAGLQVTDAEYLLFSPWRGTLVERLEGALAKVPLGAQYVVAARAPA